MELAQILNAHHRGINRSPLKNAGIQTDDDPLQNKPEVVPIKAWAEVTAEETSEQKIKNLEMRVDKMSQKLYAYKRKNEQILENVENKIQNIELILKEILTSFPNGTLPAVNIVNNIKKN